MPDIICDYVLTAHEKILSCFDRGPVACNLRQRVVLTSMFNWPRGSHSLLLLGVSFPVVLYSCMV